MPLTAERFVRADLVPDTWGLNLLIYGKPGAGKTTLATSIADVPGTGPVLLVDVDTGSRSINRPDVTVFRPANWGELGEVIVGLETGTLPYKTLIIDTLSEAYRLCMDAVLRENGRSKPLMSGETNDYGEAADRVLRMVRRARLLSHDRGTHVIFTAWELDADIKPDKNTHQLAKIRPDLSPKLNSTVGGIIDSIVRLSFREGKRSLLLSTLGNTVTAKFRLPPNVTLPDRLSDPTMAALLAALTPMKETN